MGFQKFLISMFCKLKSIAPNNNRLWIILKYGNDRSRAQNSNEKSLVDKAAVSSECVPMDGACLIESTGTNRNSVDLLPCVVWLLVFNFFFAFLTSLIITLLTFNWKKLSAYY